MSAQATAWTTEEDAGTLQESGDPKGFDPHKHAAELPSEAASHVEADGRALTLVQHEKADWKSKTACFGNYAGAKIRRARSLFWMVEVHKTTEGSG